MRLVVTFVCAVVVGIVGYFIGAYAGCDWLMRDSDLCGIYGLMLTGPVGLIAGAICGWRISRPRST
jgi:hypothetical protein